jgi:8-oxo-dGTP pyrophosphatase MutT (NUDIX family)
MVEFKPAAVLIAVTERANPGVLLIHRPGTMRAHAGQVALPGGRLDPGENEIDAAVREANEELGIDPHHVDIIGPLDTFLTGSGYAVTPVLALIPPDLPLVPNPDEVAEWFEAPSTLSWTRPTIKAAPLNGRASCAIWSKSAGRASYLGHYRGIRPIYPNG